MRDSDTYLAILDKGRADQAHRMLLRLGRVRFSEPGETVAAAIRAITDLDRLDRLSKRLLQVSSWQELLAIP